MVHVAVVIIQQIESERSGGRRPVAEYQVIEIACPIYAEGAEPVGDGVAIEIPELDSSVVIFIDKPGSSQTISVFLIDHRVGEKMTVELVRQPKGLLVGQGIRVVQPPAGNIFKGTQVRFGIEGLKTLDEISDFFRGGRRRERELTHFITQKTKGKLLACFIFRE